VTTGVEAGGRRLKFNLFSYIQGVVHLDPERSDGAFQLGMTEESRYAGSCVIERRCIKHEVSLKNDWQNRPEGLESKPKRGRLENEGALLISSAPLGSNARAGT
jgi:hypothetical protein